MIGGVIGIIESAVKTPKRRGRRRGFFALALVLALVAPAAPTLAATSTYTGDSYGIASIPTGGDTQFLLAGTDSGWQWTDPSGNAITSITTSGWFASPTLIALDGTWAGNNIWLTTSEAAPGGSFGLPVGYDITAIGLTANSQSGGGSVWISSITDAAGNTYTFDPPPGWTAGTSASGQPPVANIALSKDSSGNVTVTWQAVSGATSYRIQSTVSGSNPVLQASGLTATNYTIPAASLPSSGNYMIAVYGELPFMYVGTNAAAVGPGAIMTTAAGTVSGSTYVTSDQGNTIIDQLSTIISDLGTISGQLTEINGDLQTLETCCQQNGLDLQTLLNDLTPNVPAPTAPAVNSAITPTTPAAPTMPTFALDPIPSQLTTAGTVTVPTLYQPPAISSPAPLPTGPGAYVLNMFGNTTPGPAWTPTAVGTPSPAPGASGGQTVTPPGTPSAPGTASKAAAADAPLTPSAPVVADAPFSSSGGGTTPPATGTAQPSPAITPDPAITPGPSYYVP